MTQYFNLINFINYHETGNFEVTFILTRDKK